MDVFMQQGGLAKNAELDGVLAERDSPGGPSLCPIRDKKRQADSNS